MKDYFECEKYEDFKCDQICTGCDYGECDHCLHIFSEKCEDCISCLEVPKSKNRPFYAKER